MRNKIIRVIAWGGWGDMLLSTPCFKVLKQKYPESKVIVYCGFKLRNEIFENNPYIDRICSGNYFKNPIAGTMFFLNPRKFLRLNYNKTTPSLFINKSAKEILAEFLELDLVEKNVQIYLTEKEDIKAKEILSQYKNPICVQITSRGINKNWDNDKWEKLIASLPEYTFIQLGVSTEQKINGAIDMLGKTSFRIAMALIKNSLSFVGVDSAFSHVTNAFNIRGVVLFGPSSPKVWGHENNINIYKPPRCSPCIDLLGNADCPYSKECMNLIFVEEVRVALLKQLEAVQRNVQV